MSGTLHVLWPFMRRQWRALVAATGGTVIIAAAEILRPFPLKFVIDHLFGAATKGRFSIGTGDLALVSAVAIFVVAIALVEAVGDYVVDVHLERAGERIVHDLRVAIYAHLQRLSLGFHQQRHTGDLVTRVTGDVTAIGSIFSSSAGTLASATLTLAGMVVVGFLIDPVLAFAAFASAPVIAVVAFRFRRRMGSVQRRQRQMEGEIASLATENLSSIQQVKALGAEQYEHGRLARKSEERRAAGYEAALVEGQFTRLIDIVGAAATAVVLVVGVFRVADAAISPGDLVLMVTYVRRVYKPLRDVAREWVNFSRSMARAERVAELLSADEVLEDRGVAPRYARAHGALEFRSVSFSYVGARPALIDVSLSIPAGERLALVGPSGAGKSTLAALAARFYDPISGRVLIDGVDAHDLPVGWLREQIGLVLQDAVLFTGTVAENIAWGIPADPADVIRAAAAVGADDFIRRLPDGYDTLLDPGGAGLSGGQRQRIAIARTLLRDPAILLLDEPTTGLDAASEAQVIDGLEVLMGGRTTVMITHSLTLARRADRVAVLEQGRLVRVGPPGEALEIETPSHQGAGAGPRRYGAIDDPRLPQLGLLLDPDAVRPLLSRSFNGGTPMDVDVRYLRYKPGTNLVVEYVVRAKRQQYGAVGMIAADGSLGRRAAEPANAALADLVGDRAGAAVPLAYEPDVGALFQWYPLDLSLPVLARTPGEFAAMLRSAGLDPGPGAAEPERLAYKPRRRAVLHIGSHVLKLYAHRPEYERAVVGQQAASNMTALTAPRLEALFDDVLMSVQSFLPGSPGSDASAVSGRAGELLAVLHRADVSRLGIFGPSEQFAAAAATSRLVATILPDLDRRLSRLLESLGERQSDDGEFVSVHGDFRAGQLLFDDGAMALTDFDALSLGHPALDAATYAIDLVRGAPGDLDVAMLALRELLAGYGKPIAHLRWYLVTMLLREAAWPFRRLEHDWPGRVRRIVSDAEDVWAHDPR